MAIGTIRDGHVVRIGDDTLRARQQAELATAAANAAAAAGNYYPSQAAGEAASATGQFFSHADGAGGISYREKTDAGSTLIGAAAVKADIDAVAAQAGSYAADGGGDLVGFKATSGTKSRKIGSRLRESVSLADYWTPGDATSTLGAAFASAFTDGRFLEVPKSFDGMTFPNSGITVPANKGMVIGGRMAGGAGSALIQAPGTGEFFFEGGHLQDITLKLTGITPRVRHFSASGYANTAALLIQGSGGQTFTNALIDGLDIRNANYGVLEQGGDHASTNLQIVNGRFADLHADAIELNVCAGDRNTLVQGHVINHIDGTNANWGIAVGVANSQDFVIDDIQVTSVRQGVHAEYSTRFTISNVRLHDISSAYGVASGLEIWGVITYGCDAFDIAGVRGDGDVGILFGAPGGVYSVASKNFTARNVHLDSGRMAIAAGPYGTDTDSFATIENVELSSGRFSLNNYCHRTTLRNVNARLARASGQAVLLQPGLNIDGQFIFKPANERMTKMVVENVCGTDEWGADSVAYRTNGPATKASVLLGFTQQRVRTRECNFATSGGTAYRGVNRAIAGDFGGFGAPCGMELYPGDHVVDFNATTPSRQMITGAGSRNMTADNFILFDKANRVVKSTNRAWTSFNQHEVGQRIDLSNVGPTGGALSSTVVRTYISSSNYLMEIADVPTGTDGTTTGTITATQVATWQAV